MLDDTPVLVVELRDGDDVAETVPEWLPCVVVGLARDRVTRPAPAGVDLAVVPDGIGEEPPGWVAVPDPAAEVERLRDQVRSAPQPSVALAQVLRASPGLDVDSGLLVESLAYSTLQAGPDFASWLARRARGAPRKRRDAGSPVIVARDGDVLSVTLNRPHVRNAVDTALRDALADALSLACADPSIASVALRGEGPDFSSGGDLDEFGTLPDPSTAHLARVARSPARLVARLGGKVTAHLHGACIGAGIELAAFAGTVLATEDVRCQLPEVSLGLVPGSGGTVSITRRIGRHRTAWLGLGTPVVDAVTALRWGLVDRIVPQP